MGNVFIENNLKLSKTCSGIIGILRKKRMWGEAKVWVTDISEYMCSKPEQPPINLCPAALIWLHISIFSDEVKSSPPTTPSNRSFISFNNLSLATINLSKLILAFNNSSSVPNVST